MSLPEEEKKALDQAKEFLYDLMNPKETPKVPKYIRLRARNVIKHYPLINPYDSLKNK
jgi:hypothetical protein